MLTQAGCRCRCAACKAVAKVPETAPSEAMARPTPRRGPHHAAGCRRPPRHPPRLHPRALLPRPPAERFFADRSLLLRFVVLWPAKWLAERGVSLPAERYQAIMVGAGNPAESSSMPPRWASPAQPCRLPGRSGATPLEDPRRRILRGGQSLRPRLEQLVAGLSKATVHPAPQRNAVELLSEAASLVAPAAVGRPPPSPRASSIFSKSCRKPMRFDSFRTML